jgi:carboxymethylenebutenolidase
MEHSQDTGLKRRTFLKAAGAASVAAAGYAAAVQPISAETIHTPDTGLVAADITVERDGAKIPVYLVKPSGAGPFPTVIVIHEIFGQHEHIRDVARRFAKEGFIAAAPELYFREGGVKQLTDFPAIIKVVQSVPDRQVLDDLGAVLKFAKGLPDSNGFVGATGFCWGGGMTWLFSIDNPGLSAGVAWYGRLDNWGTGPLHPNNPIDRAAAVKCPMLGLYAGKDQGISVASVNEMKARMEIYNKTAEFMIYPDAEHGFNADYRPSYNKAAAEDGWKRAAAWLKKYAQKQEKKPAA